MVFTQGNLQDLIDPGDIDLSWKRNPTDPDLDPDLAEHAWTSVISTISDHLFKRPFDLYRSIESIEIKTHHKKAIELFTRI